MPYVQRMCERYLMTSPVEALRQLLMCQITGAGLLSHAPEFLLQRYKC
jgi:hypothetical protein